MHTINVVQKFIRKMKPARQIRYADASFNFYSFLLALNWFFFFLKTSLFYFLYGYPRGRMNEYKKLPSAKNILGDFCDIQFCGCISKSQNQKWHSIQRTPWSSYHGVFTRETLKHLCQMMAKYRIFVFVNFLFLF